MLPLPSRPLALVGLPGAGKTAVGRVLAARLGLAFADSDEAVARAAARPLPEIFAAEGEAGFRRREAAALTVLLDEAPIVIATGGGAMADPVSGALLRARATIVWLDAHIPVLAARLAGGPERPLLPGRDREPALAGLLAARAAAYARADLRIATDGLSIAQVAAAVAEWLEDGA